MDRPISTDHAVEHIADVLRDVGEGESYLITAHGKPMAKLTPVLERPAPGELETRAKALEEMLAWLRTQPIRYSGPWTRDDLYRR